VPYGRFGVPYATSFATAPSFQQELDALQADAEWLKSSLESITKRIAELEAGKTGD
jgi:prefoldin subunit 5